MITPTIGCVAMSRVTVSHEDEIEKLHMGNTKSGFGLFGWSPSVIRQYSRSNLWHVQTTGHSYPLDMPHSPVIDAPYALLDIEHTHSLLVYLNGDTLPAKVYETIKALVSLPDRNAWLLSTRPQGKQIEVLIYHLSLVQKLSYVAFHPDTSGDTLVTLFDEPVPIRSARPR